MQCKGCKYPDSQVVKTTHDNQRNAIARRRECLRCGLRFTTYEKIKDINDDARVHHGLHK